MSPSVRLLLAVAALILTPTARAVPVYLLTQDNRLVTMDSASPGTAPASVAITGLGTFNLVGIDVRTTVQTIGAANPGVGTLWALGYNAMDQAQLFVINPATAFATPVGPVLTGIDGTANDNGWFFGHDPGKDRFRMINAEKNYELNPNTLTFVRQTDLAGFPALNGSAFETKSFGQASRIYFTEQGDDTLETSANIATGSFTEVGPTGVSFSLGSGLDIAGDRTLLAATVGGDAMLYNVNRNTGAATPIGAILANLMVPTIRAIAIAPPSFPPKLRVTVQVKGPKRIVTTRPAARVRGTAKSLAGIKRVTYQVGKAKPKRAKGTVRWNARIRVKPGTTRVAFRAIGRNDVVSKPVRVRIQRK